MQAVINILSKVVQILFIQFSTANLNQLNLFHFSFLIILLTKKIEQSYLMVFQLEVKVYFKLNEVVFIIIPHYFLCKLQVEN